MRAESRERPVPAVVTAAIRAFRQSAIPPRQSGTLNWARVHASASALADLGHAYLRPADSCIVERLLRSGRHAKATQHFCDRFSARYFPLEYIWSGRRDDQLLLEVTAGIQQECYGENWEELGDLWSLKTVFLLSWALLEDPYGELRDEFMQDEAGAEGQRDNYRLCDEARDAIAQFAQLDVNELFAEVPVDGFDADYLRPRFNGTVWEPLLWAAPWLWRLTGNRFLDRADEDYGETEPWSHGTVLALSAEYREAVRIMRAIHGFDEWLSEAPAEHARGAVAAAVGAPCDRISTLVDLPIVCQPSVTSRQRSAEEGLHE
jgi:hypothetical protein